MGDAPQDYAPHDVAVAMANWNGLHYIGRCLESLECQSLPLAEIVVVDNGSTDGSPIWIRQHFPDVRLIENERNTGYAAGYNRAIAETSAAFVLVLNTDVFLENRFVEQALEALDSRPDAAAATGRVFQEATDELISGGYFLRRQIRILPLPLSDVMEESFGVSGAVALFRRAALDDSSQFDEFFDVDYFTYGEDIDLAWRARLRGWAMLSLPVAAARHIGSASLQGAIRFIDKPRLYQRHALKNRYLTIIKNASPRLLPELTLILTLTELLLWPILLVRRPLRVPYLLLCFSDVVRLLPAMLRKRRTIQSRRLVPASGIRRFFRGI